MNSNLKIAFMGTGAFALHILTTLVNNKYNVAAVYTKINTRTHNNDILQNNAVYNYATSNNINVYTPANFKLVEDQQQFINANFDIAIVASYGLILPKNILNACKFGCINAHGSLLPYFRGASPIQMSILHNQHAGITIIKMDEGLDTGDIIDYKEYKLTNNSYFSTVLKDLSYIAATLIVNFLNKITSNIPITYTKQNSALSTYAKIITKKQGLIDFCRFNAAYIVRQIKAFELFPTSYFVYNNTYIKVLQAKEVQNVYNNKAAGTILDNKNLLIMCNNNTVLQIDRLQRQSKKAMLYNNFKQGFTFKIGDILST